MWLKDHILLLDVALSVGKNNIFLKFKTIGLEGMYYLITLVMDNLGFQFSWNSRQPRTFLKLSIIRQNILKELPVEQNSP